MLSQLFGGNDLFTTMFTSQMGRGKLQCGIPVAGGLRLWSLGWRTVPGFGLWSGNLPSNVIIRKAQRRIQQDERRGRLVKESLRHVGCYPTV